MRITNKINVIKIMYIMPMNTFNIFSASDNDVTINIPRTTIINKAIKNIKNSILVSFFQITFHNKLWTVKLIAKHQIYHY